jgi:hypothetical protein
MAHIIVVVDGMGGGIGAQLVAKIKREIKDEATVLAVATNAVAAQRMVDAGADRGASGENVFRVTLPTADFILGPVGIVLPNALMGEVTSSIAEAILSCRAKKILLPLSQSHISLVGVSTQNVGELIEEAVSALKSGLAGKP